MCQVDPGGDGAKDSLVVLLYAGTIHDQHIPLCFVNMRLAEIREDDLHGVGKGSLRSG